MNDAPTSTHLFTKKCARVLIDIDMESAARRFPLQVSAGSHHQIGYPISNNLAEAQILSPTALLVQPSFEPPISHFPVAYLVTTSLIFKRLSTFQIRNPSLLRQFDHSLRFSFRYGHNRAPLARRVAKVDDVQTLALVFISIDV
jgi:hypothetical protein